jgi:hypothetical protein
MKFSLVECADSSRPHVRNLHRGRNALTANEHARNGNLMARATEIPMSQDKMKMASGNKTPLHARNSAVCRMRLFAVMRPA